MTSTPIHGRGDPAAADPLRLRGTIAYDVGGGRYLNITNRCSARCGFCERQKGYAYRHLNLRLHDDPTIAEIIDAAGDATKPDELVFCGYGEPTVRIGVLCDVADWLRRNRARRIRLNTNGHGNLIHRRNILPDLAGRIDAISISLNTADPLQYGVMMGLGRRGRRYFDATVRFARMARDYAPEVTVTAVALPDVDLERARRFATEELGTQFRVRPLF